jgi:2-haloacid dehalogenase
MNDLPLIVFDVNETLLDLTTLEPTFERIFRDKGAMRFCSLTSLCIPQL